MNSISSDGFNFNIIESNEDWAIINLDSYKSSYIQLLDSNIAMFENGTETLAQNRARKLLKKQRGNVFISIRLGGKLCKEIQITPSPQDKESKVKALRAIKDAVKRGDFDPIITDFLAKEVKDSKSKAKDDTKAT